MKIKSSSSTFFPKLIIGLLIGVLATIALIAVFGNKWQSKRIELAAPRQFKDPIPSSVKSFLSQPATLKEVFDYFDDEEIFIGVKDEASNNFSPEMRQMVRALGGEKWSKIGFRNSYAGYFNNGKIQKEIISENDVVTLEAGGALVKSAGASEERPNFCSLTIDRHIHENDERGLHIFVKSSYEGRIFHYVFDFYAHIEPRATADFGIQYHQALHQVELVLSEKALDKLEAKRKEALEVNLLMTDDDDWVNADLVFDGQSHRVEVRLKGDLSDHFAGDKWSFRVKMRDDETILGMRKFSLHHPYTRNYVGEWLFHQLLKKQNLLSLNYDFVQFWLHKPEQGEMQRKNMRIYALEEAFDKLVFERQQRRAGVIIKLDESIFWEERATFMKEGFSNVDLENVGFKKYPEFNILPFGEKAVMSDPVLRDQFEVARDLFQSYLLEERKATDVFDVEKLVDFHLICQVIGSHHALIERNWRLYYNPISSRLEPIGFDANGASKINSFRHIERAQKDLEYFRAFNKRAQEVIESGMYKNLQNTPGLKAQVEYLQREYKSFWWNPKLLNNNLLVLKNAVLPTSSLHVYLEKIDEDHLVLSVKNFGTVPVELKDVQHENNRIMANVVEPIVVLPDEMKQVTFQLNSDYKNLFVNKKKKKSAFVPNTDIRKVHLRWNTIGTTVVRDAAIAPWSAANEAFETAFIDRRSPMEVPNSPFLKVDEAKKIIHFKSGEWELNESCRLPAGYTVQILSGTKIRLTGQNAQILSYSPVRIIGTEETPVVIESLSSNGGGFAVLETSDTSVVRHCVFSNLGNPQLPGWSLSGAVNFYKNPVKISNTIFKNNRTEDGLNIINSYFEMDRVAFSNTQSDAFDGDFVEGSLRNCTFRDLGNDAIDISGSNIKVSNTLIFNANDKGLSAGEKSKITGQEIIVKNSEVAIACKDLSEIILKKSTLEMNKLAFTAFQKKPEFGPCKIVAYDMELKENELDHLIETGSSLLLNGMEAAVSDGVKERMYGVEFGKSTR